MRKIIVLLTIIVFISITCAQVIAQPVESSRTMQMKTSAFRNNKMMPSKYTRFGANINPSLTLSHIPDGTESLALIVEDPDASGKAWVHWVMFNIPVVETIREKSAPGIEGKNDFGNVQYDGPQPPSGTHRYIFTMYALNTTLLLEEGATKEELLKAMQGAILEKARLVGLYARTVSDKRTKGHFSS